VTGLAQRLGVEFLRIVAQWRGRLGPARRWLSEAQFTSAVAPDAAGREVRVAAVQFPLRLCSSSREYAQACYLWTRRAVEAGAQLVVFPELIGFVPLLGLVPGIGSGALGAQIEAGPDGDDMVAILARAAAPILLPIYHFVFRSLARQFGVHIAAGSALVLGQDESVSNVVFVFGPNGAELGRQAKCHLYGLEFVMGLARGNSIEVFDTPIGKLACPVCMDHTYFETGRIAYLQDAEILLDSSADAIEEYSWWYQLRGVWGRVQESPAYGVQAMMVGDALGMPFRGRSAVFGPVGLVGGDGALARAQDCDRGEVVIADLNLEALRAYRRDLDVQPRYDWCARHLGTLWEQLAP